eukprot:GHVU01034704.1.p1 GENE.GHVU01034704.1~~GHVU01034704.1.p1  ORF type:complete len:755 (-),score=177.89 GHVU01034704.1:738-3002(-)
MGPRVDITSTRKLRSRIGMTSSRIRSDPNFPLTGFNTTNMRGSRQSLLLDLNASSFPPPPPPPPTCPSPPSSTPPPQPASPTTAASLLGHILCSTVPLPPPPPPPSSPPSSSSPSSSPSSDGGDLTAAAAPADALVRLRREFGKGRSLAEAAAVSPATTATTEEEEEGPTSSTVAAAAGTTCSHDESSSSNERRRRLRGPGGRIRRRGNDKLRHHMSSCSGTDAAAAARIAGWARDSLLRSLSRPDMQSSRKLQFSWGSLLSSLPSSSPSSSSSSPSSSSPFSGAPGSLPEMISEAAAAGDNEMAEKIMKVNGWVKGNREKLEELQKGLTDASTGSSDSADGTAASSIGGLLGSSSAGAAVNRAVDIGAKAFKFGEAASGGDLPNMLGMLQARQRLRESDAASAGGEEVLGGQSVGRYVPIDDKMIREASSDVRYGIWRVALARDDPQRTTVAQVGNDRGFVKSGVDLTNRAGEFDVGFDSMTVKGGFDERTRAHELGIIRGNYGLQVGRGNIERLTAVEAVARNTEFATLVDLMERTYGQRVKVRDFEINARHDFDDFIDATDIALATELLIAYKTATAAVGFDVADSEYGVSVTLRNRSVNVLRDFDEYISEFQANWGNGWQLVMETDFRDPFSDEISVQMGFGRLGRAYAVAGLGVGNDGLPLALAELQTEDVSFGVEFTEIVGNRILIFSAKVGKFTYTFSSSIVPENMRIPALFGVTPVVFDKDVIATPETVALAATQLDRQVVGGTTV